MNILPAIIPWIVSRLVLDYFENKSESKRNIPADSFVLIAESFEADKDDRVHPNYKGGDHIFGQVVDQIQPPCAAGSTPIKNIRKAQVDCRIWTGGFLCNLFYKPPTASSAFFTDPNIICTNPDLIAYILSDEEAAKLLNPNP